MIVTELHETPFDPIARMGSLQDRVRTLYPSQTGAVTQFVGYMRDHNQNDTVRSMQLEYYPGMTDKALVALAEEAKLTFDLQAVAIDHRVGHIDVGDAIVLIAVWASHRAAAFEANEWLIEALKHRVPLWKQETLSDGQKRWVNANTPGRDKSEPSD